MVALIPPDHDHIVRVPYPHFPTVFVRIPSQELVLPLLDHPQVQVHTLDLFVDCQNLVQTHREVDPGGHRVPQHRTDPVVVVGDQVLGKPNMRKELAIGVVQRMFFIGDNCGMF